jgi:hypothetical protein
LDLHDKWNCSGIFSTQIADPNVKLKRLVVPALAQPGSFAELAERFQLMTTIDELPGDLRPFEADLFFAVYEGLTDFHDTYVHLLAEMTKRTQRSLCHDCIANAVRRRFPANTIVRRNLFLIELLDKRIKVKALDELLRPKNNTTQLVFDFMRQHVLRLFETEETVNLVLGYQPHDVDVRQSRIWLTYPNGRTSFNWVYELRGDRATTDTTVITLAPEPPTPPRVRPRVSPRRGTAQG